MEKIKQSIIEFLRNQGDKPFVSSSKGSWTTFEMADEVERDSNVGIDMVNGLIILTCDLIVRGKQKLPSPSPSQPIEKRIEDVIVGWLKSENENATYCAHMVFEEFQKFTLLKSSPTIATDNTLPVSQPKGETADSIAQWVISNRWPKGENDKVSDAEMFVVLKSMVENHAQQARSDQSLAKNYRTENYELQEKIKRYEKS